MLVQHLRRWTYIVQMLHRCFVFAGFVQDQRRDQRQLRHQEAPNWNVFSKNIPQSIYYFYCPVTVNTAFVWRKKTFLDLNSPNSITKRSIHIVASELRDPIWHSSEWQIGSFSSEVTIYSSIYTATHDLEWLNMTHIWSQNLQLLTFKHTFRSQ